MRTTQARIHPPRPRWGVAILLLALVLALGGCTVAQQLGISEAPAAAQPALATPIPSPSPVVVSTPANTAASGESVVAGSAANRRLSTSSMTYNGEIMAESIVPVVAQAAGRFRRSGWRLATASTRATRWCASTAPWRRPNARQAQAALELTQSQLELAKTQPKKSDLDAAEAAVKAARAGYDRALKGPTDEDKRMTLAQLRQAEAAVKLYQSQYDRIAGNPFAGMMPESLQLQQATLMLEQAQAGYDKLLKGATADQIAGAYAQLTGAEAQLARLKRGAEPAQIKAAEAGVKQAEAAVYLAQLQLDKTNVEAPADGFIYKLDAVEGGMAGPGAALAVIFSNDVKIIIPVEESRFQDVRVGQPVTIQVDAYPDRTFDGVLSEIAPTFDHATRTVQVTVKATGDGAADLRPGMFATVQLLEQ